MDEDEKIARARVRNPLKVAIADRAGRQVSGDLHTLNPNKLEGDWHDVTVTRIDALHWQVRAKPQGDGGQVRYFEISVKESF
jgi:hypothetical protein